MINSVPPTISFYAAVGPDGAFSFHDLHRAKRSVQITGSDRTYGGVTVRTITMKMREPGAPAAEVSGWIVLNPDNTWWLDSLSATEAEAISWMSDRARMELLGFKAVEVGFFLKKVAEPHG